MPVVRAERLVGLISRSDLIRLLLNDPSGHATAEADRMIRDRLLDELRDQRWAELNKTNVEVKDGIVHLWGIVGSVEECAAMRVAAENIAGVRAVHLETAHRLI